MRPRPAAKAALFYAALAALALGTAQPARAQTTYTTTSQPQNSNAAAIAAALGSNNGSSGTSYTGTSNNSYNPYGNPYGSNGNTSSNSANMYGATSGSNSSQQIMTGNPYAQQQQQQGVPGGFMTPQGMQNFYYAPGMYQNMLGQQQQDEITPDQMNALLKNPDSAAYKANKLADKAKKDGAVQNFARSTSVEDAQSVTDEPTPPELGTLQDVHKSHGTTYNVTDAEVEEELLNLDIRRDAQREAALSYGARGGLAKRQYQIAEKLDDFSKTLDRVFNFRALLVKSPSGLMIEPPIVRESLDNIFINDDGTEGAVAQQVLDINKQAKIVPAPRDWRNYLVPADYETDITPPPRVLWPKDDKEQLQWNTWVKQGWDAGYSQGEESFETNLNQLVSDYNGMVRYRMLLAQGKISAPFAMQEDRGVTGGKNIMRVGDSALRITGPSEFLTGSDQWKPADR